MTASLVGTAVEFYDFYIFGTAAALVFGPLFFKPAPEALQQFASYALFSVAFFARPVGAIAFGHFGDRIGRKSTLVASLLLMGLSTFAVALLPTYESAGWIAPLVLVLLRFGQGFGLGGEWGGAALLAVENAPEGWKARYGMFPQFGAPVGFIAANGLFLVLGATLSGDDFRDWGWRVPFAASLVLVAVGLYVRLRLTETPAFQAALAEAPPPKVPFGEVVAEHFRPVVAGTLAVVCCFAVFYITTTWALGYGVSQLHYGQEDFLGVQLGAIGFMALGIYVAGVWSDRTNARRVLAAGCGLTVVVGALLGPLMGAGSLLLVWAFLSLGLFAMGLVYGPLGAFLPSLFPARVRYTGVSMAFNIGGIIGGGLAPMTAQWLAEQGGLALVGVYLAAAAGLSLAGLAMVAGERRLLPLSD
ncbi:MAG: MFS transporter [Alphaproteobacteria bacterium]|nr:MFS transporter [Alphaproteobacteria bacterium]